MLKQLIIAIFLTLFALPVFAWEGRVVSVTDGDTLTVEPVHGGDRVKIRLWGIDAPEIDQPGGVESKKHCLNVALWQNVAVKEIDIDRYGRLLAVVVRPGYNGKRDWSINGNMVLMGHAWAWLTSHRKYETV